MKPILLAEDNEDDVFFMQRAFKGAAIRNRLIVVKDGQEAIDYLEGTGAFSDRKTHPFPGLVLLDIKLPLRTGFEVLQHIRASPKLKSLPAVVLTTSSESIDVDRGFELGANSYMVKPPTPAKLANLARDLKLDWLEVDVAVQR